jgi:UDP-N-acetylglucosamine--N-acetylmuramyl-(pentapeptide) pyrophosphoryl-undecaprenol N-acetylglucosamine transferase
VMGGSQGASAINSAMIAAMPALRKALPDWQWLHLAGTGEAERVRAEYLAHGLKAVVYAFLDQMELALGAADIALTRAGGSSMAELAAMRVPALLVPYPAATDNHQWHNARAFEELGCGRLLEQASATPQRLVETLAEIGCNRGTREAMKQALGQWHKPDCAVRIAQSMMELGLRGAGAAAEAPFGSALHRSPSVIA